MEQRKIKETLIKVNKLKKVLENKLNEASAAQYDPTNEQWAIKEFQKIFTSNGLQAPTIGKIEVGKWNKTNYPAKLNGIFKVMFSNIITEIEYCAFILNESNRSWSEHSLVSFIICCKWKHADVGESGHTLRYDYDIIDKKQIFF